MIQMHEDYLVFKTADGDMIPCSVELIAHELVSNSTIEPEVVRQAAAAVLHYFKHDLGRNSVSIAEFTLALEQILASFGFNVKPAIPSLPIIPTADLRQLVSDSGEAFELAFFQSLREELRRKLADSSGVLDFQGLRDCVKQLLGAKRWSGRCQILSDQIVDYLRQCLTAEEPTRSCGLLVR